MTIKDLIKESEEENYHKIELILTSFKKKDFGYEMSIEAINEIVKSQLTKAVQKAFEEVVVEEKACKFCGSVVDEKFRFFNGDCECSCEDGKYSYQHKWDDIGYNQAISDIQAKIDKFLNN